jgi:multidrug transporter EmrE-like cation transporter
MSFRTFLLILVSVSISALAQVALKRGMSSPTVQIVLERGEVLQKVLTIGTSPMVVVGIALYGLGAVVWLLVLARVDVSQAYPFVGLGFLITLGFGVLVLGEIVTFARLIGIGLVAAGIIFLSQG